MGCDIHPFVERIGDGGTWEPVRPREAGLKMFWEPYEFDLGRDYPLFSLLADVRNYWGEDGETKVTPLVPPRGIPLDISPELKAEYERSCDHSPTWFLVSELMQDSAQARLKGVYAEVTMYVRDSELIEMLPALLKLSRNGKGTDVRLLVWFDN